MGNSTCSACLSTSVHIPSTQGKHQAVSAYVPSVKGGAGQPRQNPQTGSLQFRESLKVDSDRSKHWKWSSGLHM